MSLTLLRITKGYIPVIEWAWLDSYLWWRDERYGQVNPPWSHFPSVPTTTEVRLCFPNPEDEWPVVYLLPRG
ncbi:MAG: hypothetical protein AAFX78_03410 [Cyanobacteria bacterium J06638_20]